MIIMKPDHLAYIESIFGAILYIFGMAGSYFRFGNFERRGKIDAIFLASVQWGGALLLLSLLNIVKYSIFPTLHTDHVRVLYYTGTLISSSVFFVKSFEAGIRMCRLATCFLWGTIAFIVGEGLVFYFDLSYSAAIFSCVGLLVIMFFRIFQQPNLVGMLAGMAMLLLPIIPKLSEGGFNLDTMNAKRELAVGNLLGEDKIDQNRTSKHIVEMKDLETASESSQTAR